MIVPTSSSLGLPPNLPSNHQFCANDPEQLLRAALKIQHRCDAIDINL
jgi:tRNA-dihydrouridine synthase 1